MIANTSYNLLETFSKKHIPLSLLLEITKRCNWNCGFCYAECSANDGLEMNMLLQVLKEFKDLGTFQVTLTGGEPFLKTNIWDIIQHIKNLGFALNVNTNGSLLHNFDIEKIAQMFSSINISLHSIIPGQHDEIVGVDGAWKSTIANLFSLKKYNAQVEISTVITSDLAPHYKEMKKFVINDLEFKWNPDIRINPTYSGKTEHLRPFKLNEEQQKELNQDIDTFGNSIYNNQNTEKNFSNGICRAGSTTCFLDADGYLYPCLSFKRNGKTTLNGVRWLENVKDKPVTQIWKGNYMFQYLRNLTKDDFTKCLQCNLYKHCFKCMAENYIETDSPILPSEKHCEAERAIHIV